MNFKESVEYLFGLGYELSVKKFGLENTYTLLNALGDPQKNFVKVQVAGTNGKGSTCAFLESILTQSGIKVGVNTSPHLVSVTERIRVNGFEISEKKFAEYVTKVRKISKDLVTSGELEGMPTFFEHITCIAQMVFADEGVDVAVLETGLGGRFDATTATEAEIVALSSISLDHTKTLGDTIEKIASEKAAIIRANTKAFAVPQAEEARQVIEAKCKKVGIIPFWVNTDIYRIENSDSMSGFYYHCDTNKDNYRFDLSLPGEHQTENAALALHVAEGLTDLGFEISKQNIEQGLENAKHKGRLEFSDGILYDGAHNVSAAEHLRIYLLRNKEKPTTLLEYPEKPLTMIFGAMGGKNLKEMSKILFPLADQLIFTTPENPRAMPAKEIAEFVPEEFDRSKVFVINEIPLALAKARELAGKSNQIVVTGSLYLIGEIQAHLKNRKVERRKKKK